MQGRNVKKKYRVVYLKYVTLVFTIPNVFEWIHTKRKCKFTKR